MTRASGFRTVLVAAVAASAAAGITTFVGACTDQTTPPSQCLASFTTTAPSTSAGSVVTLDLALENPDAVSTSSVYVDWSATGGGTLGAARSTATLTPQTDPTGRAGGAAGTATTTFRATGPSGQYVITAAVEPGGACPSASYTVTIQVSGQLLDAGPDAAASDAGADAADAGPTPEASADTAAPDAPDANDDAAAADAPIDG